ncbi:NrtR DNA-binding winged helix domain-containing protein [Rhizobium sp. LCM 4573]|uniref:NrtR DNA-binding winged helix domain-containing protein n=1 Tax=Rhizobium sp. LCM 4573 TaxID=1848291 RepID=UPI0008DB16C0|nr:hypothetical protein [Rhizobium sp. LCM 4573]OHV78701.1 hypothetical protein LCM4573_26400 [Rhizobium sp. LCM 4573]
MNNPVALQVIVTTVLLTLEDGELRVVLTPAQGEVNTSQLGLFDESIKGSEDVNLEHTVRLSLERRAAIGDVYIEQLETFSGAVPGVPETQTIQICYIALAPEAKVMPAIRRSTQLRTLSPDALPSLPYHGNKAVAAGVARLRLMGQWSIMPAYLLDREFTISQLNAVYDAVVGTTSFGESFRRKILKADVLVPVGARHTSGATKKSEHYSIRPGAFETGIRL